MSLTHKDFKTLTNKPNKIINGHSIARARLEEMPDEILNWYAENKEQINAKVVIVRSKEDEANAAKERNSGGNILFVFSERYCVTSYFSGTSQIIKLSNALINRAKN